MTLSNFLEAALPGNVRQDVRDAPDASGVYVIANMTTRMAYIGQSRSILTRFRHHHSNLRSGTHANRPLQQHWTEYGEDAFRFLLFSAVGENGLRAAESQLIGSSKGSCYNTQIAQGCALMSDAQFEFCAGRAEEDSRTILAARAILSGELSAAGAAERYGISRQVSTRAAKKIRLRHETAIALYAEKINILDRHQ